MAKEQHTQGPWRKSESPHRIEWAHWIMAGDAMVAAVTEVPKFSEMSDANARLISAAPQLLAACIEADRLYTQSGLLAQTDECGKWISKLRQAIGRTEKG